MDFSFSGVSLSVSIDEITKIYHSLSSYINKDRNTICLGLILIDRYFLDWYTVIKDFTSQEIARQLLAKEGERMSVEEATKFLSFTKGVRRAEGAKIFQDFLEDIEKKYYSGELKKLESRISIKDIIRIRNLIVGNRETFTNSPASPIFTDKESFWSRSILSEISRDKQRANKGDGIGIIDIMRYEEKLMSIEAIARLHQARLHQGNPDAATMLNVWLQLINSLREDLSESIRTVISGLGCEKYSLKGLYDEIQKKVI